MANTKARNPRNHGFTLIELSIVLVIIGLIVGGVLVGQSLIRGAEIRAAVSQIEKYDAAANTFRNKYKGLPGDMKHPENFGFDSSFDAGFPNGNGRIESYSVDQDPLEFTEEAAAFFRHLSQAGLIADAIPGGDFQVGNVLTLTDYVPLSKVGNGAVVLVGQYRGANYYLITRSVTTGGQLLTFSSTDELRVIDAFQIDTKLDDGIATTGRVRAVWDFFTADTGADCHTDGVYDTAASANVTSCTLRIRTSF